jgi:hypothetical protein
MAADLDSIVEFKPEGCVTVAAFAAIAMRERDFRVTHCECLALPATLLKDGLRAQLP